MTLILATNFFVWARIFLMEYDRRYISLFEMGSSLPSALITLQKRYKDRVLTLSGKKSLDGYLFLFNSRNYYMMRIIKNNSEFSLPGEFDIDGATIVEFFGGGLSLIGASGKVEKQDEILKTFLKRYREVAFEQGLSKSMGELNMVVDDIILKMFGKTPTGFFNHTSRELNNLFSSSARAEELEKIIPSSKFIKTLSMGEEAYAGVVYSLGAPFAVAVGYKRGEDEKIRGGSAYQFFSGDSGGYFLSFRRASDGDNININVNNFQNC